MVIQKMKKKSSFNREEKAKKILGYTHFQGEKTERRISYTYSGLEII